MQDPTLKISVKYNWRERKMFYEKPAENISVY